MIEHQACFQAFALFEKGVLPFSGGWMVQPEWWLQVFEVIGAQVALVTREQSQRAPDEGVED